MNKPLRIAPARAWRTYQGGSMIAALHGEAAEDSHFPEEWLMSTVTARNPGREHIVEGLSMTADGQSLREIIAADPEGILGEGRQETGMLMKLIDAAERLSVQVHPTRADAMRLFQSPFGKTECWHILGGRTIGGEAPYIYFGFREGITAEKWADLFYQQDIPGMLECLHRIEVKPGETYLIHGGVPHAIGAGCFLAEIQEPTDLTLRVERTSPAGDPLPDQSCHQGVGFEAMLSCFDYTGLSLEQAKAKWCIEAKRIASVPGQFQRMALLSYDNTPFFSLEHVRVITRYTIPDNDAYTGFYVLEGKGSLIFDQKQESLEPGVQYFIPAHCTMTTIVANEPMRILCYAGPKAGTN